MPRQNLLIVDGDARNRRVLEVSLRKAGFSITAAASAETALEFLNHAAPDLIISDTRLPGEDGFALCTKIKSDPRWRTIPFIFLTGEKSVDEKVRGLELGVEDYLTKPIWIKEITTRVIMLLQRKQHERIERRDTARTKFTGRLADMAVVDLLQTIEISRKSGVIHFGTELGEARVWFREGAVIDAEMGRLQGEAAVYRLLSLGDGDFELEFKPINRSQAIFANTQALLMDGMRRVDEWGRLMEQLPPLDAVLIPDAEQLQARKSDLGSAQIQVLRLFDGRRSILEVVDHSGGDDLEVLTIIGACYFEGLLTVPADAPEPAHEPGAPDLDPWDVSSSAMVMAPGARLPGAVIESSFPDDITQPILTDPELPPPPSYPEPFPQLAEQEPEEDGLVPGIPEDSAPRPAFGVAMLSLDDDPATPPDGEVLRALRSQLDAIELEPPQPEPAKLSLVTNGHVPRRPSLSPEALERAVARTAGKDLAHGDGRPAVASRGPEATRLRWDERTLPYAVTPMQAESGDGDHEPERSSSGNDRATSERAANEASQQTLARVALRRAHRTDGDPTVRERLTAVFLEDSGPSDARDAGPEPAAELDDFGDLDEFDDALLDDDTPLDEVSTGSAHAAATRSPELDDDVELVTDDQVTFLPGDDGEAIAPMSKQVSPPTGVPRAAASGIFDTSNIPTPDPAKLPTFVGDVGRGLEGRIDSRLRPQPPTDEPTTLELHTPLEDDDDDDELPAVRLSGPAQESGPWAATAQRPDERRETVALAVQGSRVPYGLIAAVISAFAVAGFAYGVRTHPARSADETAALTVQPELEPERASASDLDDAVTRAEAAYRDGDLEAARVIIDRLLAFRPKDARALVLRSTMLIETGRIDDALVAAQAAVEAEDGFADAHLTLGVIQQERGELEDAVTAYRRYLELSPKGSYAVAIRRQLERVEEKLASIHAPDAGEPTSTRDPAGATRPSARTPETGTTTVSKPGPPTKAPGSATSPVVPGRGKEKAETPTTLELGAEPSNARTKPSSPPTNEGSPGTQGPGKAEGAATKPEVTKPEAPGKAEGATKPEVTKPEAPGKAEGATKPEVTKPEAPGKAEGATKPEATKPEATKPEVTKPEATKPEVTKPEAPAEAEVRTKPEAAHARP